MRKKAILDKNRDYRFAFQCADSFFNLAKPYLNKVGNDLNGGVVAASQDPGGLVSAATNLALALELYLKSLRMGLELSIPETHNLWTLYKSLPSNVKRLIEQNYNQTVEATPKEELKEIKVAYELGTADGPKVPRFPKYENESKDVKAILKRSANAFQIWRYIYESIKPGERYYFIRLEYSHLILLCYSVREYIQENDPKNIRQEKQSQ